MKQKYDAVELIIMMLAFTVCIILIMGVGAMIFFPDKTTVEGKLALMDLLKYIMGVVSGALAMIYKTKKDLP